MANLKLDSPITFELSKNILEQTSDKLGFVPNMYHKMAHNPALLDSYTHAYASFRKHSGFTPIEQEVVLLSVALENSCTYCMAAHSFVADNMTMVPTKVTDAIRSGTPISDPQLAALSKLTRLLTRNRGAVTEEDINNFLSVGYTEKNVLGIITGIAVKTMSNYTNYNSAPEIDEKFASRSWAPIKK